ncbi:hypothetical protein BDR06DRAFT_971820 [Suillus hirtellus]|nr:hypothetical protein BDR06DRAFT_971820 [Suillus hirtellus]
MTAHYACVLPYAFEQPGFLTYFNMGENTAYSDAMIGTIHGIFSASGVCGAFADGWMCNRYGRQITMTTASVFSILANVLLAGSVIDAMLFVVRFIPGRAAGVMVGNYSDLGNGGSFAFPRGLLVGWRSFLMAGLFVSTVVFPEAGPTVLENWLGVLQDVRVPDGG